jgi:hypothetical protein
VGKHDVSIDGNGDENIDANGKGRLHEHPNQDRLSDEDRGEHGHRDANKHVSHVSDWYVRDR